MKKSVLPALLMLVMPLFPTKAAGAPVWELDLPHSNFYFSVDHIYSAIRGHFRDFSGTVAFDPNDLESSRFVFEIKVDSIDTSVDERDQHLLTADFFNESEFPLMRFTSTAVTASGPESYEVAGKFLVKGREYDLVLPLRLEGVKDHPMMEGTRVAGFNGELTIDRLAYGVGTGKFWEMGVVGREVDIVVSLEVLQEK